MRFRLLRSQRVLPISLACIRLIARGLSGSCKSSLYRVSFELPIDWVRFWQNTKIPDRCCVGMTRAPLCMAGRGLFCSYAAGPFYDERCASQGRTRALHSSGDVASVHRCGGYFLGRGNRKLVCAGRLFAQRKDDFEYRSLSGSAAHLDATAVLLHDPARD